VYENIARDPRKWWNGYKKEERAQKIWTRIDAIQAFSGFSDSLL